MRPLYTLLFLLFFLNTSIAQYAYSPIGEKITAKTAQKNDLSASPMNFKSASCSDTAIWLEDFESGIPGTWQNNAIAGPCNFEYTLVGHQGDFPSEALMSTTAANGWVILDSDNCNTDGGPAEVNELISESIDLSNDTAVTLRFEQYMREFQNDITTISVGSEEDGTITWTDWIINEGVGSGMSNPNIVNINIKDAVGGHDSVYVKFRWEGQWDYGWQFDDVGIYVTPVNDIVLRESFFNYSAGNWEPAVRYGQIPSSQMQDIDFSASIENIGQIDQPSVRLDVDVTGSVSGPIANITGLAAGVNAGETDTIESGGAFTSVSEETFTMTYTAVYDSTAEDCSPENNVNADPVELIVTEFRYGKDNNVYNGTNFSWVDLTQYEFGTVYEINADDTIKGIGFVVGSGTELDEAVYSILYRYDEDEDDFVDAIISDDEITLKSYHIPDGAGPEPPMVFFPFNVPVQAGEVYMPAMGVYNNDNVSWPNYADAPLGLSFVNDGAGWANADATPYIRLFMGGVDPGVGIEELDNKGFALQQNQPNPFQEETSIQFELTTAKNITLNVHDMTGKLVHTVFTGNKSAGQHNITLDAGIFETGIYYYTLQADGFSATKKMIVLR